MVMVIQYPFQKLKIILPHVILIVGTIVYMLMGAGVFYLIERPHEEAVKKNDTLVVNQLRNQMMHAAWNLSSEGLTKEEWVQNISAHFDAMLKKTFEAFKGGVTPDELSGKREVQLAWTYPSAVFFTTTVLTTVGYGHLVPVTVVGRVVCVAYALFGIPLALITIADIGKFVGQGIAKVYESYEELKKRLRYRRSRTALSGAFSSLRNQATSLVRNNANEPLNQENNKEADVEEQKSGSAKSKDGSESGMTSMMEEELPVSPSLVLLILLSYTAASALLFYMVEEEWSFLDSFYYCFITMVTVGFGDMVPTKGYLLPVVLIFIFSGLILTTMCIDLVGTHYIRKIHYFGRSFGDWWRQMKTLQNKYGLTEEELLGMMSEMKKRGKPFTPSEAALMSYIDHVASTDEAASLISCLDL